jgi:enoyl-CoA hydratase/carnithine racemase
MIKRLEKMTATTVCVKEGYVARIVLNNPARHNALGETELLALQDHFNSISEDGQIRVLVLTSHGDKTFCAGAALDQLRTGQISPGLFQATTDQLESLRVPTICALNGNVFGGGVELALSCDFRVGLRGTRMRVPAAQIGLCYPLSGIQTFVQKLGLNLAKRMLVAAEEFSAEEMLHIGFLDHLVDRDGLEHKTQELVDSLTSLAPIAVQAMKHILNQAATGSIDAGLVEALSRACAESEDLREGFLAQSEKRAPHFKGK